jgi:uncharacterized protein with beta-barrel porin domain
MSSLNAPMASRKPSRADKNASRKRRRREVLRGCTYAAMLATGIPPIILAPFSAQADVTFTTPIRFTFSDSSPTASQTIGSIAYYSITGATSGDYVVLFTKIYGTFVNKGVLELTSTNSGSYEGIYLASDSAALVNLTNNGTISVSNTYAGSTIASEGIYNYLSDGGTGSIGTISNTGLITVSAGAAYGIQNGSSGVVQTIGTIINSGTIEATGVNYSATGIRNQVGWIGSIQNSGKISAVSELAGCTDVRGDCRAAGIGNYSIGSTIVSLDNKAAGTIYGSQTGVENSGDALSYASPTAVISTLTNSGLIQGGYYGVVNQGGGYIASLTNSGTITGGSVGIANYAGSIGSLTNSGTITGGSIGISNYLVSGGTTLAGKIDTITNSGLITGSVAAIDNAKGSINAITNSGTIAGTILSGSNITINGGSGATGTLTGYGGTGKGSIIFTSGDLLFSSGSLLLNDDASFAAGHGVTNSGSNLTVTQQVSITGDYTQTGGALVIGVTSTGGGELVVSGTASISGGSVSLSAIGGTLGATTTYTLVHSGILSTYTGLTVSVPTGYTQTTTIMGTDLIVTLTSDGSRTYRAIGSMAGGNGGAVGAALDSLTASGSTSTDLQSILNTIGGLSSTSAQAQAIQQLAPSQSTPSSQMAFIASQLVTGAVEQHQQLAMAFDAMSGKAAGSDSYRNAMWGQFLGGGAWRGSTADSAGYHMREVGLATGVDHSFSENLLGGVAFSWVRAYASASGTSATNATMDKFMLIGYGSHRLGQLVFDGQTGLGYDQFHQERRIAFLGRTATADFGGLEFLLRGRVGYDIPLADGVTATPLVGMTFLRSDVGGYTETGAGAANLTVRRNGANSLAHDVGFKVGWILDTAWGQLRPEVRAEWVHDYTQTAITTNCSLDGAAFNSSISRNSPDGAQLGLAATLNGSDNLSFRAEYNGEMRSNYQSHTGMIRIILSF